MSSSPKRRAHCGLGMRDQCLNAASITLILFTEFRPEPFLFECQLADNRDKNKRETKESLNRTDRDDRSKDREKKAAVDGVTNRSIGACFYDAMVHFDRDPPAPVFAEMDPCPDREAQPGSCEDNAYAQRDRRLRPEWLPRQREKISGEKDEKKFD